MSSISLALLPDIMHVRYTIETCFIISKDIENWCEDLVDLNINEDPTLSKLFAKEAIN